MECAVIAHGKVRTFLEDLVKNPEALVSWQIAQGNAETLLSIIREAADAEELKRLAEREAEFNEKTLFSGVGA